MPLRILLAAEFGPVRRSLETLLEQNEVDVVGQAADGPGIVALARVLRPDVAILDLCLSREETLTLADDIRGTSGATRVILVQGDPFDGDVHAVFGAGISGVVLRAKVADDLVRAIRDVGRGEYFLSPCASRALVQAHLKPRLAAAPPCGRGSRPHGITN
ncbi:MAG TPA: response regulator [Vicinamibacterales bacterium]|jgi:DNA-binding NarL/FixJ family response regulator